MTSACRSALNVREYAFRLVQRYESVTGRGFSSIGGVR